MSSNAVRPVGGLSIARNSNRLSLSFFRRLPFRVTIFPTKGPIQSTVHVKGRERERGYIYTYTVAEKREGRRIWMGMIRDLSHSSLSPCWRALFLIGPFKIIGSKRPTAHKLRLFVSNAEHLGNSNPKPHYGLFSENIFQVSPFHFFFNTVRK